MVMNVLEITNLSLVAGEFQVRQVSLNVKESEFFVLMGAIGSGKSLVLKAICGLTGTAEGSICIGNRDVTLLEPRERNIGYVPQGSHLFPHLSVQENILFPLTVGSVSKNEAMERVADIVDTLRIGHLLTRSTLYLSGGERQKVTLARALAKKPELLLLDEPLSALDEATRSEICTILKRVQREFKVATIHVCHNMDEARAVADRIGVMDAGHLVQTGTLNELIEQPKHDAVSRIIHR